MEHGKTFNGVERDNKKRMTVMYELLDRIGMPIFIQLIIESRNSIFLIIMIFSLIIVKSTDRRSNSNIPLTDELITFFAAIFLYNFFDMLCYASGGNVSTAGRLIKAVSEFGYFAVGAFRTLFFLQLIRV